jgi:hypothetical protein
VKDVINILQEFCVEVSGDPPTYEDLDLGTAKIPKFKSYVHPPMGCGLSTVEGFLREKLFLILFKEMKEKISLMPEKMLHTKPALC